MEQISTISIKRSRLALLLLASSVFAVGTEGLVFAGLLPALSSDLGVSLGAAGQVTTVFALCYAVFAPLLSMSTESLPRRTTLLIGLGLFVAGNALSATAPAYWCLLIWRAVTAAGASLITPTATLIAASLARPDGRVRAIAVVMTGMTLATAAGAPLGTVVGGRYGWRNVLWGIAFTTVLVGVVVVRGVPALPGASRRGLRQRLAPLRVPVIRWVLATTLIGFVAVYLFYAYLSVVYAPFTAEPGFLALVLAVIGAAGAVGNLLAGRTADRRGASPVVTGALLLNHDRRCRGAVRDGPFNGTGHGSAVRPCRLGHHRSAAASSSVRGSDSFGPAGRAELLGHVHHRIDRGRDRRRSRLRPFVGDSHGDRGNCAARCGCVHRS